MLKDILSLLEAINGYSLCLVPHQTNKVVDWLAKVVALRMYPFGLIFEHLSSLAALLTLDALAFLLSSNGLDRSGVG